LSTKVTSVLLYLCMALIAMAVLVPASKADSVNYTFTGSNGSFSYTSNSGLIAPGATLTLYSSEMNSCTGCAVLSFIPSANLVNGVPFVGDLLEFGAVPTLDIYAFQYGAFDTYGTHYSYDALYGSGTLTVTQVGTVATPEPSSLGLLAVGLLLMAGLVWRKRNGALATTAVRA
jgi:PEP-CTERM motif